MNWKVLALIASMMLASGLNACSSTASNTEASPSAAPSADTGNTGDAMKNDKAGDAMKNEKK